MADKPKKTEEGGNGTQMVSVRIPNELLRELDALEEKLGTNRSEVIIKALRTDLTALAASVLQEKMDDIKRKIDALPEVPKPQKGKPQDPRR